MNSKRLFTGAAILFFANILFKGLFPGTAPNSLSVHEIDLLTLLHLYPSLNTYWFRFIPVIASSCIVTATYLMVYRLTRKGMIAFTAAFFLTVSPWIVILSRFFNPYVFFLLIIVSVGFIRPVWIRSLVAFFAVLFFRHLFISSSLLPNMRDLFHMFEQLLQLFDFRTLFFVGEPFSYALQIPKTGFFMYVDFFMLIAGFFALIRMRNRKFAGFVTWYLAVGIFFYFFTSPDTLFTYRGLIVLYALSIVIGTGYAYIINRIYPKHIFLVAGFAAIIAINFVMYQEYLFAHFDKYNSFEWGYAEQSVISYYRNRPGLKVYVTDEAAGKLNRYAKFFLHHTYPVLTINQMKILCAGRLIQCIVREDELQYFHLQKDQVKLTFSHYGGLPMYFVIR